MFAWLVHFFRGQWSLIWPFYRPFPCGFIGCDIAWEPVGKADRYLRGECSRCGTEVFRVSDRIKNL